MQKITKTDSKIKRLRIRAWRRGTREMDLILGRFVDAELEQLTDSEILAFERLMAESDSDLYLWISGTQGHPEEYSGIISRLRAYHGGLPCRITD